MYGLIYSNLRPSRNWGRAVQCGVREEQPPSGPVLAAPPPPPPPPPPLRAFSVSARSILAEAAHRGRAAMRGRQVPARTLARGTSRVCARA